MNLTCTLCKLSEEDVKIRESVIYSEGNITVTIHAPLCIPCSEAAPERIKALFANPMLKSVIKVAGVSMGLTSA